MMKPRINRQVRKQLKAERKLEAMVKYQTKSIQETKMAITSYVQSYGNTFFIDRLTDDYEKILRGVSE